MNYGSQQRLNNPLILPIGGVCSATPPRGVLSANPPIPSCNQTLHEYTWAPDGDGTSDGLDSWSGFSLGFFVRGSFSPTNPRERTTICTFPAHGEIMARVSSFRGPLLVLLLQLVLICSGQVRLILFLSVFLVSPCLCRLMWQKCRWVFSWCLCWKTTTLISSAVMDRVWGCFI